MSAGVAIAASGVALMGPAHHARAVNLLVNGGFEENNGFNGDNAGFGWFNDSDPTVVFDVYSHADQDYNVGADPTNSGDWYFHSVGVSSATGTYQDMDLTGGASAAQIDAGTAAFDVQAFLSGFGGQNDHARIEITFADANGSPVVSAPSVLDGGVQIIDGALVFDSPDTFVGYVDPSVDPLLENNRNLGWREYRDIAGVPVGARTARVTIYQDSFTGNGNDNYTDNLSFDVTNTAVEQFLKIVVNKATGAITLENNSEESAAINFYEISSVAGVLNPDWVGFADQMLDSQGAAAEQNWQEGGGSNDSVLTEAFLSSSSIDSGETQTLTSAYAGGAGGAEDLSFLYGLSGGGLARGIVSYITPAAVDGDYNSNGIVDAADYTIWRDTLGSTSDLRADGDGSGDVGAEDFAYWKSRFGNTSGAEAGISASAAVPEPGSFVLMVGVAGLLAAGRIGKRRG